MAMIKQLGVNWALIGWSKWWLYQCVERPLRFFSDEQWGMKKFSGVSNILQPLTVAKIGEPSKDWIIIRTAAKAETTGTTWINTSTLD